MLETQRLSLEKTQVLPNVNEVTKNPPVRSSAGVQRVNTVAGVTAEAREVLEQFLRRSLSDVNQRGRPGNYYARQPLAAIAEHDRISVDHHEANSSENNKANKVPDSLEYSLRKLPVNGNGFTDVNRNVGVGVKSSQTTADREIIALDVDTHNGHKTSKRMLAEEEVTDLTDVDEDQENDLPKKKKSFFKRAKERLQATFRRQSVDKESVQKHKDMHSSGSRNQGLFASFRHKSKKDESTSLSSTKVRTKLSRGDSKSHKRDKRKSDMVDESGTVKAKSPFSSLKRSLSSIRVKRSKSKESNVSSVEDAINLASITDSQQRILEKYSHTGDIGKSVSKGHIIADVNRQISSGDTPSASNYADIHVEKGNHEVRSRLQLNGLQVAQPERNQMIQHSDSLLHAPKSADSWDYIDGVVEDKTLSSLPSVTRSTDRPFDEKSPGEKEELFERIASQLAEIGDLYKLGSPLDGTAGVSHSTARSKLTTTLPPPSTDGVTSLVSLLLNNANYGNFQRVVSNAVSGETGLQQIALVFHATKAAMQLVGTGTSHASRIKDMTLQYFEENLASWIIQKGGWASVVDDSTTTDSELD